MRVAQATTTSSPVKPTSTTPCRWWCSEEGCHRAKKCKFVQLDWLLGQGEALLGVLEFEAWPVSVSTQR